MASGCRPSHEGRLAGLHTSRSNLHCVAKASECAVAREKWRMSTQNIEGILMLGNPVRRRRARAPKGNRLRAVGARGEPILTSKAIRRGAENCRRTDGGQRKHAHRARGRLAVAQLCVTMTGLGLAERPRTLAGDRYLRLRLAGHLLCRLCAPGHCRAVSVGLAGPVTAPGKDHCGCAHRVQPKQLQCPAPISAQPPRSLAA